MRPRIQLIAFALLLALVMTPALSRAQDSGIKVEVSGFRNNNGLLRCSLWSGPDGFPRDDSHIWKHASGPVKNSSGECVFGGNIPAGDYAVTLFHDENGNGKFDRNWLGLPKEGYAFSNNVRPVFSPPSFKAAAFDYAGGDLWRTITMRY